MKIAFYLDFSNMSLGGIYTYAKGVLSSLMSSDEIEKIYIVHSSNITKDLESFLSSPKVVSVPFNKNKVNKLKLYLSQFLLNIYYLYKKDDPNLPISQKLLKIRNLSYKINPLRKVFNKLDVDVVHIPLQSSPVYGINKPLVVTVHDVQEIHFPQFFTSTERMHRALYFKICIDEADQIVVWFEHVKEDVVRYFKKSEEAVDVCMPNVINDWYFGLEPTDWETLSKQYNLRKPFVFYPSATWEHKNHIRLVEAIALLVEKGVDINLYCTGNQAQFHPNIENKIDELKLQDRVKFLKIVPEKDLLGLYRNTELAVLASLYEGGGIPAFEAMRLGVPVICSDIYAFRQSINNPRFMFDPQSSQSIADLIAKMLSSEEEKIANLKNGTERVTHFENFNFSENFVRSYQKAISHKPLK